MSSMQTRVYSNLTTAKTTLNGAAQQIFISEKGKDGGDPGAAPATAQRWIKAAAANAAPCYIGPAGVTVANGYELSPGDSVTISGPSGSGYMGDVYVIGTNADIVTTLSF